MFFPFSCQLSRIEESPIGEYLPIHRDGLNVPKPPSALRATLVAIALVATECARAVRHRESILEISKEELEVMVDAIDAEDGSADGMFHGEIV